MKTNIYFLETNAYNAIIFDQETAHYIALEHPDTINNIDLYAPDAAEQLKIYFNELITSKNIDITSAAHPNTIIAGSFTPNTTADIDADKVTMIATFDAESIDDIAAANGL